MTNAHIKVKLSKLKQHEMKKSKQTNLFIYEAESITSCYLKKWHYYYYICVYCVLLNYSCVENGF